MNGHFSKHFRFLILRKVSKAGRFKSQLLPFRFGLRLSQALIVGVRHGCCSTVRSKLITKMTTTKTTLTTTTVTTPSRLESLLGRQNGLLLKPPKPKSHFRNEILSNQFSKEVSVSQSLKRTWTAALNEVKEATENKRNHPQFKSSRPSLKDNQTTQKTA